MEGDLAPTAGTFDRHQVGAVGTVIRVQTLPTVAGGGGGETLQGPGIGSVRARGRGEVSCKGDREGDQCETGLNRRWASKARVVCGSPYTARMETEDLSILARAGGASARDRRSRAPGGEG